ncbi:MAG: peptidylprolyl isomerase [Betaproteobacteria bacterium]|nr:peptidylprolyl isomerase [Betaproteobacteria bacterium]
MKNPALILALFIAPSLATYGGAHAADAAPKASTPAAAPAAQPTGPVATVNGIVIPASHAAFVMNEQAQRGKPVAYESVRSKLITLELLAQEARKRQLDTLPAVRARIEILQRNLLADALLDAELTQNPVSDAAVRATYDTLKAQKDKNAAKNEYRAAHILVSEESLAKSILADLKKKKSFADLAKKHSKDPGSAKRGGDLDWMSGDDLVPEFAQALASMKAGQLLDTPVKTQFGWHIIRLDATRPSKFPEFAEVKDNLREQMIQHQVKQLVDQIQARAKVE